MEEFPVNRCTRDVIAKVQDSIGTADSLAGKMRVVLRALLRFSHRCEEDSPLGISVKKKTCEIAVFIAGEMIDKGGVIHGRMPVLYGASST